MEHRYRWAVLTLLGILCAPDSHAYEVVSERFSVSPGYGRFEKGETKSWFSRPPSDSVSESIPESAFDTSEFTASLSSFEDEISLKYEEEVQENLIFATVCG
jgi:hypothetical protein